MTGIAADELVCLARTLSFEPGAVTTLADRLGAYTSTAPSTGLLVTFDGQSATGKDTQILLLAAALRRRGLKVRQSHVRAGGTGVEKTLVTALRHNVGQAHPRRWHTDLLLKLAGWTCLTRLCGGMDAEVVVSNRSGISALAYSAATLGDVAPLAAFVPALAAPTALRWLPFVLCCAPDVAAERARRRALPGHAALRPIDDLSFITRVCAAFDELSSQLPVIGIDAARTRDEVHCDIGTAVTVALDSTVRRPAAAPASRPCPRPPETQTAVARPPCR